MLCEVDRQLAALKKVGGPCQSLEIALPNSRSSDCASGVTLGAGNNSALLVSCFHQQPRRGCDPTTFGMFASMLM
jgi:hypothetical protein